MGNIFICTFVPAIKKLRVRVKAAAQHSSSELGSALALHFPCSVNLVGGAPAMRDKRVSNIINQFLGGAKRQSRAKNLNYLEYGEDFL